MAMFIAIDYFYKLSHVLGRDSPILNLTNIKAMVMIELGINKCNDIIVGDG